MFIAQANAHRGMRPLDQTAYNWRLSAMAPATENSARSKQDGTSFISQWYSIGLTILPVDANVHDAAPPGQPAGQDASIDDDSSGTILVPLRDGIFKWKVPKDGYTWEQLKQAISEHEAKAEEQRARARVQDK